MDALSFLWPHEDNGAEQINFGSGEPLFTEEELERLLNEDYHLGEKKTNNDNNNSGLNDVSVGQSNAVSGVDDRFPGLTTGPSFSPSDQGLLGVLPEATGITSPISMTPDCLQAISRSPVTLQSPSLFQGISADFGGCYVNVLSPAPAVLSPSEIKEEGHDTSSPTTPAGTGLGSKRKRNQRSESVAEGSSPPVKKLKLYEIRTPPQNKKEAHRRRKAVNAKRHRDQQKQDFESIKEKLETVTMDRDSLKVELTALKEREKKILKQLEMFKRKASSLLSEI